MVNFSMWVYVRYTEKLPALISKNTKKPGLLNTEMKVVLLYKLTFGRILLMYQIKI